MYCPNSLAFKQLHTFKREDARVGVFSFPRQHPAMDPRPGLLPSLSSDTFLSNDFKKPTLEDDSLLLQDSVYRIPPEIWGSIFGHTLGLDPYGLQEYRTYGYLRQVCKTWRDVLAGTPDLCRGLVVDLDGPLTKQEPTSLKDSLQPWLAIVSRNHPYHLVLGALDDEAFGELEAADCATIFDWIFTTKPPPTILSINNYELFAFMFPECIKENQISQLTFDFWGFLDPNLFDLTRMQDVFPRLNSLTVKAITVFTGAMGHTNIQSLTLSRIVGEAAEFATFLMEFPALRQLEIGPEGKIFPPDSSPNPFPPLIHPTLEILVMQGEDPLLLLELITFPSLKFLALSGCSSRRNYEALAEIVPAFLSRCSLDDKNFTASIRFVRSQFIFDLLMRCIPRGARLHVDVDTEPDQEDEGELPPLPSLDPSRILSEIFFIHRLDDIGWLKNDRGGHLPSRGPSKVYLPGWILDEDEVAAVREELKGWGHTPELLAEEAWVRVLQSSIPHMPLGWEAPRWRVYRGD
jgi:hypothetical protein